MQFWLQILTYISTSVTTTVILGYLSQLFLKSRLDKDLEKFKSDLVNQQFEFQKRFSLIHEKRAEVIVELYSRLDRLGRKLADLTSPLQWNDGITVQDKETETHAIAKDFSDYYSTKKIYFDESLCNQIEEIEKILKEAWDAFETSHPEAGYQNDEFGLRKHSSKLVKKIFPHLKKELEKRFRKELGAIDGQ